MGAHRSIRLPGPNLSFRAREAPAKARSWLHLDLYAEDRDGEVARLMRLGARRHPWRYRPGADYIVLADPDDNLFCVYRWPVRPPQRPEPPRRRPARLRPNERL